MMKYYCPNCHKEIKYNADLEGYYCDYCGTWWYEWEVKMEEDDYDDLNHHL